MPDNAGKSFRNNKGKVSTHGIVIHNTVYHTLASVAVEYQKERKVSITYRFSVPTQIIKSWIYSNMEEEKMSNRIMLNEKEMRTFFQLTLTASIPYTLYTGDGTS